MQNEKINSLIVGEKQSLTLCEKIDAAIKLSETGTKNTKICSLLNMDIRTLKKYLNMSEKERKEHLHLGSRESIHNDSVAKKSS